MRWIVALAFPLLLPFALPREAAAETYNVGTWDYERILKQAEPGDTVILGEGDYPGLPEIRLNGRPDAWIVIKGADGQEQPRILAQEDRNTVEIRGSSYVAIENLTIDGRDRGGVFAISASAIPSHHIRIENCRIVGHGYDQSTVAISTKVPCWNWVLRRNTIVAAGTGAYLGNSDGMDPFIGGLIEYNLFLDSRGYNMQIKHQVPRDPTVKGLPTTPQKTIIRHNVFLKGELDNDSGERPNLLVGALPTRGPGSEDGYEIYGNLFYHNHRESLLQAEGRVSIHDNVFVDCTGDGVHLQNHYGKVQCAYVYDNTFYGVDVAVRFVHPATDDHLVAGNLMFANTAITGPCANQSGNLHAPFASAKHFVRNPSFDLGKMDFYPLPGKCRGDPLDLSRFVLDTDSGRDFNGTNKGDGSYRGAYAGEGTNPGWQLDAVIKGELSAAANDHAPPDGSIRIGDGKGTAQGLVVDLGIRAGDAVAGMGEGARMRFSNDGRTWSEPEPFAAERRGWDLAAFGGSAEPGLKVVFARVSDAAGNWSRVLVDAVEVVPAK
ncbi:MAG TPA: hypothetical protein VFY93_06705 [Planctomycetota bacterium]|nr:hypothetical protein [Planctomycetota bacterium]